MGAQHRTGAVRRIRSIAVAGAGLLAAAAFAVGTASCNRGKPKQHVVLIVVDTLRGDKVEAARTPNMDRLAFWGDSAERAWSTSSWTAPSMMSMFSGATVREHGWDFPFPDDLPDLKTSYPPMADMPLLAEVLSEAGFATTGFYNNPLLGRGLGFERGFDMFVRSRDNKVARLVQSHVESADRSKRQFLYVHLFGTHQPLVISAPAAERHGIARAPDSNKGKAKKGYSLGYARNGGQAEQDTYRTAYLADLEDIDVAIGDILEAADWIADDAVIVVTSDHGELLGEHDLWGHGAYLWEPLTHVPMIVKGGGDLPDAVSIAAVPSIVTTAVGVSAEWPTTVSTPLPLASQREGKLALLAGTHDKVLWNSSSPQARGEVYDLQTDPYESSALLADAAQAVVDPAELRQSWESRVPARQLEAVDGPIDAETMQVLEALGYVE